MEYRHFLAIDMSLYRHKKIIFGGCAKFHSLLFLKYNMAANTQTNVAAAGLSQVSEPCREIARHSAMSTFSL